VRGRTARVLRVLPTTLPITAAERSLPRRAQRIPLVWPDPRVMVGTAVDAECRSHAPGCCAQRGNWVRPSAYVMASAGSVALSGIRRSRPWRLSTLCALWAMVSQEPCLGVSWRSSLSAKRFASAGGQAAEREPGVGVELVEHEHDPLHVRGAPVHQGPELVRPADRRAPVGDCPPTLAHKRFIDQEEVGGAAPLVFLCRSQGGTSVSQRRPHCGLHVGFSLVHVRLQQPPAPAAAGSSSRRLQRPWPASGVPQASAIRWASGAPSSFRRYSRCGAR